VTYWTDGKEQRILATIGPWLYALDARTGRRIPTFGVAGRASLKAGLGPQAQENFVVSTTPGTLFEDFLVMPTRVGEAQDAAPGWIQAFNVRTGTLAWVFRTIPYPGEAGYDTWPRDAYKNIDVGSANCWAGMSIDRARGLLYVPTGSAAPDFWGGHRLGSDLFANCLLALDARTGKLRWYYQCVHHDIWDRDLPAPPNLVTIRHAGRQVDAVAQITKSGRIFVFDRVTGDPLFPIEEVPVPPSPLAGEEAWPTQPIPALPEPFARQSVTVDDLSPYAENREALAAELRQARVGAFQPFGTDETILLPGFDGGGEWGGAAVDPDGILYVNASEMAWIGSMRPAPKPDELAGLSPGRRLYAQYCAGCHGADRQGLPASGVPSLVDLGQRLKRDDVVALIGTGRKMMPAFPMLAEADRALLADSLFGVEKAGDGPAMPPKAAMPYVPYRFNGYKKFLDSNGYPAIRPPWGSLTAIDLNTGKKKWQVTLGEFKELTAKGIPLTGTENYGGPVVTAGGLLFIAATKDGMFRAFDKRTGKLLWETELPAAGFATPCTYEVAGKQYVVVSCGGSKLNTAKGDSYVAFALP
jgi:quinoprotein glucose dehydrogenase